MVLTISTDMENTYYDVTTKNKRFANYPLACKGRFGGYFVALDKDNWFEQAENIASWVNNELKEECLFEIYH